MAPSIEHWHVRSVVSRDQGNLFQRKYKRGPPIMFKSDGCAQHSENLVSINV